MAQHPSLLRRRRPQQGHDVGTRGVRGFKEGSSNSQQHSCHQLDQAERASRQPPATPVRRQEALSQAGAPTQTPPEQAVPFSARSPVPDCDLGPSLPRTQVGAVTQLVT